MTFHTLSDQFGPYYTKVIAATASEAPHVLDGLLYHQTGLQIEDTRYRRRNRSCVRPMSSIRLPICPADPRPQGSSSLSISRTEGTIDSPSPCWRVCRRTPYHGTLGRYFTACHLNSFRYRHRLGHATEAFRLSSSKRTCGCATRARPDRTNSFYLGLAQERRFETASQCWSKHAMHSLEQSSSTGLVKCAIGASRAKSIGLPI